MRPSLAPAEAAAPARPNGDGSRVEVLDSLRAFAALSVCLFHFVCTTTGYVKSEWALSLASAGQYGVQSFFVISGFVIPWAMHNAGYRLGDFFSFLLKRIARLEPPYLFSLALALLLLHLRQTYLGRPGGQAAVTPTQVALHVGYLIPFFKGYHWVNPVYWTLAIEFQYYLLIALLYVPLVRSDRLSRGLTYLALVGASFVAGESFLPHWLPVFLLGILVFLLKSRTIRPPEYWAATAVVVAACLHKYPLPAVAYAMVPVACLLFWPDRRVFGLHALGKVSYSVYLIHPLVGASLINVLSHHYRDPAAKVAVIAAGLVVTLAASWLTYAWVEGPSRRASSSIRYRKGGPGPQVAQDQAASGLAPSGPVGQGDGFPVAAVNPATKHGLASVGN